MRNFLKSFVLITFIVSSSLLLPATIRAADGYESKKKILSHTVIPFFEALTSGNVEAIEFYIGGGLALRMKSLLQENREYPEILRNHYADTVLHIGDLYKKAGNMVVDAEIDFPSGEKRIFEVRLSKNKDGVWKIVEETDHSSIRYRSCYAPLILRDNDKLGRGTK